MSFVDHRGDLRCADCEGEITLEQYRRKVPRCDDCHADAEVLLLRAALDAFGHGA